MLRTTPIGHRLALAALLTLPAIAHAQQLEDKLVIVTSFSKDLTAPFAQAFEKKHPGTRVEVQNRNTAAAVAFIRETRSSPPDIMWASAPDAFEVLKKNSLLQKYAPKAQGLAAKVGTYPVNDPDGFYVGFAASGYGIMYNTRYLRANSLPAPKEWDDLKKPVYFGHVGISAPSRSGTTHLTVETILQGEGWDKGWASLLEIGGNLAQVSDRSFGVPDAVNSGQYGIGIVIDFFGLSAKASGFPVEFVYPTVTTIVPANVGIIANAKNPKAAEAFVEFLLSEEGQQILLDPKIQRLPVRPATYDKAPAGYPNPFKDASLGIARELQRRYIRSALQLGELALRPAHHVPPQGAQRGLEGDPRRGGEARHQARARRPRSCSAKRASSLPRCRSPKRARSTPPSRERSRRSRRTSRSPAARPSSRASGIPSPPRTTTRPRSGSSGRWPRGDDLNSSKAERSVVGQFPVLQFRPHP